MYTYDFIRNLEHGSFNFFPLKVVQTDYWLIFWLIPFLSYLKLSTCNKRTLNNFLLITLIIVLFCLISIPVFGIKGKWTERIFSSVYTLVLGTKWNNFWFLIIYFSLISNSVTRSSRPCVLMDIIVRKASIRCS